MASSMKSLTDCRPGKDLATKVAHAMLGWLNMYQHGLLHRDVSIGNVLAFEEPEQREAFKLCADFKASFGGVTMQMLNDKLGQLDLDQSEDILIPDAASWATELEQLLAVHKIGTTCKAFIIDGDLAKNWKALFRSWGEEKEAIIRERLGTELFMSRNLVFNLLQPHYIQSPADDIQSFFWVALYAILNNNTVGHSAIERRAAEELELDNRREAIELFLDQNGPDRPLHKLFRDWREKVYDLGRMYSFLVDALTSIDAEKGWTNAEEEAQYWEAAWHGYALQGVCESLELIFEYIDKSRR